MTTEPSNVYDVEFNARTGRMSKIVRSHRSERDLTDVINEAYSQPGWTPTVIDVTYDGDGGWRITNLRLENSDILAGIYDRNDTTGSDPAWVGDSF